MDVVYMSHIYIKMCWYGINAVYVTHVHYNVLVWNRCGIYTMQDITCRIIWYGMDGIYAMQDITCWII